MSAIPTFDGVESTANNDDAAVSEKQENMTKIQKLQAELDDEQIENYTSYEVMVDVGRFASKLAKDDDRYDEVVEWALDNKSDFREVCKEQPGNLPMFRSAFPVEDRDDVWVLPEEEAAEVGIDYDTEDYIALPIYDGTEWHPADAVEDGEPAAEPAAEAVEDGELDPSDFTIPELKVELLFIDTIDELIEIEDREIAGKDRKGAKAAIAAAADGLKAEAEAEAEAEADEVISNVDIDKIVAETAEVDAVELAKIEALKDLTKTLNKTAEAIENL